MKRIFLVSLLILLILLPIISAQEEIAESNTKEIALRSFLNSFFITIPALILFLVLVFLIFKKDFSKNSYFLIGPLIVIFGVIASVILAVVLLYLGFAILVFLIQGYLLLKINKGNTTGKSISMSLLYTFLILVAYFISLIAHAFVLDMAIGLGDMGGLAYVVFFPVGSGIIIGVNLIFLIIGIVRERKKKGK